MILVTLGTQDKSFKRLLEAIDREIKLGNITDEVVVQAGYTINNYTSDNMEIFDYVDSKTMVELVKKSDVVISHAGAGSILTALENNKKIIVVPRLSKYGEHNNDHQIEIATEFSKEGYVIYLKNLADLGKELKNISKFKPKKLGHNEEVLKTIDSFIDNVKIKPKRSLLPLIFIVLWMIIIFWLSSMDSGESNDKSMYAIDILINETLKITNKTGITNKHPSEENKKLFIAKINRPMRKLAHASVFFVLAILIMIFLHHYRIKISSSIVITLLISFMYALFDEYHQTFVIGRTGQFTDALIDSLGAILGIILVSIIIYHHTHKRKKQKKVIFISSIGGHLTQLLQLESLFTSYRYLLITEKSSVTKDLKKKYKTKYYLYCNKKNFLKYFIINILNAFHSLYTFFTFDPDVIVTTGANTAVPLCYLGRIFGKKVIFIESYAKSRGKTLAGKLCYPIATTFIVQWESMLEYYPDAQYYGSIY